MSLYIVINTMMLLNGTRLCSHQDDSICLIELNLLLRLHTQSPAVIQLRMLGARSIRQCKTLILLIRYLFSDQCIFPKNCFFLITVMSYRRLSLQATLCFVRYTEKAHKPLTFNISLYTDLVIQIWEILYKQILYIFFHTIHR